MAVRLTGPNGAPIRPLTLDLAYSQAYCELYALLGRVCETEHPETAFVLACRERTAVRLERAIRDLVPELAGVYSLARPIPSD